MRKKLLSGILGLSMMLTMVPTALADSETSSTSTTMPTIGSAVTANYNASLSAAPWTSYTLTENSTGKSDTAITYTVDAKDVQPHYTGDGTSGVDAQYGQLWWLGVAIPQADTNSGITTTAAVGWGESPDQGATYEAIADVRTNTQTDDKGKTYDTFYWNAGSAAKHQNKGYVSLKYTNSSDNTSVVHTYTVDFSEVTLVKVTPKVSTTTSIANGATNVVVTLTSDKAFDATNGVNSSNYTIDADKTGLTLDKVELDSSDSDNKTATLTFTGTAAAGTLSITAKKEAFASEGEVDENSNAVTITVPAAATPPAASTDATLQGLTLSNGTLSPAFTSATETYTATVENSVSTLTVTPTVNDSKATVTVNGTDVTSGSASSAISLNEGANTITVVVTAEDSTTTKTYTLTVTRKAAPAATLTATAKGNGNYEVNISALTSNKAVWVVTQITKTVSGTKVYLYSWNEVAQGTTTYKLNVGSGDTLELWVVDSTFTIDEDGVPSYANLWGRTGTVDLTK